MCSATSSTEGFNARAVPAVPEDPLYQLMRTYRHDPNTRKVDLGIGAYRDDRGKPWILPVVKKAKEDYFNDSDANHEYLPIQGLDSFTRASRMLILGDDSSAIKEDRVASIQTISGTGAVHLGATFLFRFLPASQPRTVYVSSPTWPNHHQIFSQLGFKVECYTYFSPRTQGLDIRGMLADLRAAPRGSIVVLQACAHNPTGIDPTADQWNQIAQVMRDGDLFPFFDCAYQGFATGDLVNDSWAIRRFVDLGFECSIAQSFAKNLGLYGERVGAFHFVCKPGPNSAESSHAIASQLALISRAEISNPPSFGSCIASKVMNDRCLFAQWQQDLQTMTSRLAQNRQAVLEGLTSRETPGEWDALRHQKGMFSFLPLSESQVEKLQTNFSIYMTKNARVSIAGLNSSNLEYFIEAIDTVVRKL